MLQNASIVAVVAAVASNVVVQAKVASDVL